MAANTFGLDKALQDLERMNISDKKAQEILVDAAEIAIPVMRENLKRSLSGESTGELINSLGISPVKVNRNGVHNIKVGFRENGRGTMTNAAKAANLEYGNSRGQKSRPWLSVSLKRIKKPITVQVSKSIEEIAKK
jgi:hypothetical protein